MVAWLSPQTNTSGAAPEMVSKVHREPLATSLGVRAAHAIESDRSRSTVVPINLRRRRPRRPARVGRSPKE